MRVLGPSGVLDNGNRAYSDSNAPDSLDMTLRGTEPAAPAAGKTVLYSADGKSLLMKAPDGTVTTIGPSAGGGSSVPFTPHYPRVPSGGMMYFPINGANSTIALTLSRLYYIPFTVARAAPLLNWGFEVTTAGATGSVLRTSIYSSTAGLEPGNKLVDASATVVATTVGIKTFTPASAVTLQPNTVYWAAVVGQTAAPTLRQRNSSDPFVPDNSTTPNFLVYSAYWQASITGATPATAATGMSALGGPSLFVSCT